MTSLPHPPFLEAFYFIEFWEPLCFLDEMLLDSRIVSENQLDLQIYSLKFGLFNGRLDVK